MIDRTALYDDLIDAFINYQFRLDNPFPSPEESRDTIIAKYNTDYIFRAKVQQLASGVMSIVIKHTP